MADGAKWELMVTPYVCREVEANLPAFPPEATQAWGQLAPLLSVMADVFTLDRPSVFGPPRDRPILFAALA